MSAKVNHPIIAVPVFLCILPIWLLGVTVGLVWSGLKSGIYSATKFIRWV